MPEKFKGTFRIPSARAPWWNYGNNGAYFITICTQHKKHFFGKIRAGKMKYSPTGLLALNYWKEIPSRFPYIWLDEFIIMPNHMHGILIIQKSDPPPNPVQTRFIASPKNP